MQTSEKDVAADRYVVVEPPLGFIPSLFQVKLVERQLRRTAECSGFWWPFDLLTFQLHPGYIFFSLNGGLPRVSDPMKVKEKALWGGSD